MKHRSILRLPAIMLAVGVLAAACSSDTSSDAGTTPAPAAPSTPAPAPAGPSLTTLTVVLPTDPVGLNPFPQTAGNMAVIHLALYHSLITIDEDGELYSDLLESWDVAPDGKIIVLNVREGIQWSDGTPVTSADIEMSLRFHLDSRISGRATRLAGVLGVKDYTDGLTDSIAGLVASSPKTVVITLENPDAAWWPNMASLTRLNPVFPAHILGDVDPLEIPEHPFFVTHPVTNGPYTLVQFVPEQFVELAANPNWSLGTPGFEKVFFKIITDGEARLAQLQSGEIQYVDGVSALDVERLQGIDGITVDSAPGQNPNVVEFANDNPLLADPRVKQAILFAIDREGICAEIFKGFCSVSPTNQRLVGLEWALPTEAEGAIVYDYDPDRARALLAEAGWDSSNTLRLLHRPAGSGPAVTTAMTAIQAQLAAVGINMEIVNVDVPTLLDSLGRAGRDPNVHMFWNAGAVFSLDPSSVQPYNTCGTAYPAGPNLAWYCVPELDELWVAGRRVVNQAQRAEIYKKAYLIVNQNPSTVNLAVLDNIVAFDSRLQGVKPVGDIWQTYWNIGEWTWAD
jgi:peptide/nickel transport system substrate-binding protein